MSTYMRELRAKVGHARIIVPSVSCLIRREDGGLLLVQQRDTGQWTTVGGAIEPEETPAEAVIREAREETGLVVTPRKLFGVYGGPDFVVTYPNGDETQYVSTMFECDVVSGTLAAVDTDEVLSLGYWTRDEALQLPLARWLRPILPRLYESYDGAWFVRE